MSEPADMPKGLPERFQPAKPAPAFDRRTGPRAFDDFTAGVLREFARECHGPVPVFSRAPAPLTPAARRERRRLLKPARVTK